MEMFVSNRFSRQATTKPGHLQATGHLALFFVFLASLGSLNCVGDLENSDSFIDGEPVDEPNADPGTGNADCTDITQTVLANTSLEGEGCARSNCHAVGFSPPVLGGNEVLNDLVNVESVSGGCNGQTYIVPGRPEESLLYTILLNNPPCSQTMPVGGTLEPEQIECVRSYIANLVPGATPGPPDNDGDIDDDNSSPGDNNDELPDANPSGTYIITAEDITIVPGPNEATDPNQFILDTDDDGTPYLHVPDGAFSSPAQPSDRDILSAAFTNVEAGNYYLLIEYFVPGPEETGANRDSFWVSTDGGLNYINWNGLFQNALGELVVDQYELARVWVLNSADELDRTDLGSITAADGDDLEIRVTLRQSFARISRIILSQDENYTE